MKRIITQRLVFSSLLAIYIFSAPAPRALFAKTKSGSFFWTGDEPVSITAERMEFGPDEAGIVFLGRVKVSQGELALTTEKLVIETEKSGRIQALQAEGRVRIEGGGWKARADRAEYLAKTGALTLRGGPKVTKGENEIEGEVIRVYPADGRVVVEKAKARVQFEPGEVKTPQKPKRKPEQEGGSDGP